jgi:PAS domain S-box-containing protein
MLAAAGVAAAYYLGARLGLALQMPSLPVSVLWPPSAILLAVFLATDRRAWWILSLAAIPAHLLSHGPLSVPPLIMFVQVTSNVGLALLGAVAIGHLVDEPRRFGRLRTMTLFILLAGIAAPVLVSLAVAASFTLLGWSRDFWLTWRVRSLSNAFAALTFAPLIVLVLNTAGSRAARVPLRRGIEASALLFGLVAAGTILFVAPTSPGHYPVLLYAPLPFLLWATVRFGVGGVCVSVLILGALAVWGAVRGVGPFSAQLPAQNVTSLLLFLNVACAPLLILAALLEERRQAGQALRESEERFHIMADTAPVMVWRAGTDALCDFFNKPWLEFTGRAIEQELGNGWTDGVHPDDLERCRQTYGEAFDARKAFRLEYRLRRFDGEYRWMLDSGVPRFGSDGSFAGYIGSCVDITDRKQAELEVQQQRLELAHLTRVAILGEMSGTLAHELNQPLAAIMTNAQTALRLLAGSSVDMTEMREILKDIVADDRRAAEVIRRVRTLLKKGETEFQALDLGEIVRETLVLAHSELVTRHVKVHLRVARDLPAVHGDRVQLQQVVLNLIVNACEAMTATAPMERTLTATVATADSGRSVQVSLQDRGGGMPPVVLERLFEPFVTTKEQGLGLGLSICRSIITAHGGRLWAANNADGGATLCFALPVPAPR